MYKLLHVLYCVKAPTDSVFCTGSYMYSSVYRLKQVLYYVQAPTDTVVCTGSTVTGPWTVGGVELCPGGPPVGGAQGGEGGDWHCHQVQQCPIKHKMWWPPIFFFNLSHRFQTFFGEFSLNFFPPSWVLGSFPKKICSFQLGFFLNLSEPPSPPKDFWIFWAFFKS